MARLSPFHMARLFREETGLPPAAFLMAVRMEEARRKLLQTKDSVADISIQVGYTSLGAFTTRFTKMIGVSPGRYRRLAALGADAVGLVAGDDSAPCAYGSIVGRIHRGDGMDDEPVYIAAFPAGPTGDDPVSCHRLARCRRVERSAGTWRIAHVPEGRWFVQAVSRTVGSGREPIVIARPDRCGSAPAAARRWNWCWSGPIAPGRSTTRGSCSARRCRSCSRPDSQRPIAPAAPARCGDPSGRRLSNGGGDGSGGPDADSQ